MTLLLVTLFLAVLATYLCTPLFETDLYLNLTVGHWIESHRAVPLFDYWNHSDLIGNAANLAGSKLVPWCTTSWLFDVGISVIERSFGMGGLLWLKIALYFFAVAGLAWLFVSRSRDLLFGVMIASAVACGVLLHAGLTPELAVLGLVAVFAEIALRAIEGTSRSGVWSAVLFIALVAAQIEPLFGLVLFVLPAFVSLESGGGTPVCWGAIGRWLGVAAILTATAFLTPYFGAQVWWSLQSLLGPLVAGAGPPATVYQFSACFLILLIVFWALLLFEQRGRLSLLQSSTALAVGYFGFAWMDCTPVAILFFGLMTCSAWSRAGRSRTSNLAHSIELLRAKLSRFPRQGVIWVLGCLSFVNVVKLQKIPQSTLLLPAKEIDYLLEHQPEQTVLYPPDIEPYVMYRGADGLGEPAPNGLRKAPAFTGRSETLRRIFALQFGWEKPFAELAPRAVIARYNSPLYTLLSESAEWTLVMRNGVNLLLPPDPNAPQYPLTEYSWAVFDAAPGSDLKGR